MHLKGRILSVAAVLLFTAAAVLGGGMPMNRQDGDEVSKFLLWGGEQKETLYFWYTDENMTSFLNNAAVTFAEREGVRMIPVLTSEGEYLEAVNRASVRKEQMPDVYLVSNDFLEKAYLAGLACAVNDAGRVLNTDNFPEAALAAVRYHGKNIAYPLYFKTSALVYNETYLEAWAGQQAEREIAGADEEESGQGAEDPETSDLDMDQVTALTLEYLQQGVPDTVDDILNIADTFDAPEGVEVMKWDVSDIFYNYWFVGRYMIVGGDAGDDDTDINIYNEETIQCLAAYQALNQFFSIESDTITYESVIRDFIEGKLMFTVATTDVIERLEDAKADGTFAFEYGISTMPGVTEELDSRSLSVTGVVAVNGYSEHKELAEKFAAYLVTECADTLYEKTGKIPVRNSTDADNGAVQIFKLEYADSVALPKMMETGNFWLQLEVLFSRVWNGADASVLVRELAEQIALQVAQ